MLYRGVIGVIYSFLTDMSHSLNSLKGGYIGDYIGDDYRGYSGGY